MSQKRYHSDSLALLRYAPEETHGKRAFSTGESGKGHTNNEDSQQLGSLVRVARDLSVEADFSSHSMTEALLLREELESIQSICVSNQTALELLERELDESRRANEKITEIIESLSSSSLPLLTASPRPKERDLSSLLDVASLLTEQNLFVLPQRELQGPPSISSLHILSGASTKKSLSSHGLFRSHPLTIKL